VLLSLIAVSGVVAGWSLLARRLEQWRITAPIFLVLAGVAASFTIERGLADALDGHVAERVAELILAVLLFVDATDVRGGLFGKEPRSAVRVLFVALPLSLALAVLLGLWLLPDLDWPMLVVVVACVVMHRFRPSRVDPARRADPGKGPGPPERRGRLPRRHRVAVVHLRSRARR
jgi:uncharacterized membrane protein